MTPARSAPRDLLGALSPSNGQAPTLHKAGGSAWSLWLWVAAGFLFLGLLWTAMFIAARRIDTRTVPLTTTEAKP